MNYIARFATTAVIWLAVMSVALGTSIAGGLRGGELITIVGMLGFFALVGTRYIWKGEEPFRTEAQQITSDKAKRSIRDPRERLIATLNALDEDEASALLGDIRARLMGSGGASDGELSEIDQLIRERRSRQ
jgi:hypothetical protein